VCERIPDRASQNLGITLTDNTNQTRVASQNNGIGQEFDAIRKANRERRSGIGILIEANNPHQF
jgi:hypothetical protein